MFYILDIISWFFKMSKKRCKQEQYYFRAFKYEEIKPNKKHGRAPCPRSGHRIVAGTKHLYSFGGYNPLYSGFYVDTYPLFQELWRFNYASKVWTLYTNRKSLPQELASNAVVKRGNLLMVYGGTGSPFGQRCSNQLHVCHLVGKDSTMCEVNTSGQHPLPQYGQAIVYHNGFLYTIGGTTGYEYTCDIHRLNLRTLLWEAVYICQGKGDYEPAGRYRHEVAFDGKNIYILGGGTSVEVYDFHEVPVFNIEKCEWYQQKTLRDRSDTKSNGIPPARRCHGAVQLDTNYGIQIFITGGYNGVDIFDDLWKLDLNTFQWTLIDTCRLPRPLYFHSTAVSPEGKLYVFGGIYTEISRSNEVYATWLCVPKLSEICWEALLHYSPNLVFCKKDELIDAGLPRCYVNRLEELS